MAVLAVAAAAALASTLTEVDPALIVTLGAFLVTAVVAARNGHRWGFGALAAGAAAAAALVVDLVTVHVVGAGYPILRMARQSVAYSGLLVAAVGLLAMLDHPPADERPQDPQI